jgi:hypothetical protein
VFVINEHAKKYGQGKQKRKGTARDLLRMFGDPRGFEGRGDIDYSTVDTTGAG